MDELTPTARWTVTQPWRGLFGIIVTLGLSFTITAIFDIASFNGIVGIFAMSCVPIQVIMGMVWGGQYPPMWEKANQAWRGLALTVFMGAVGILAAFALINFRGAGVVQPFVAISLILTIVTIFWLVIAFGTWPWHKMSLPAKGMLTLVTAYLLGWGLSHLFNFDLLSYPTGVKPSPIGAVPFYAEGGPLAVFGAIAPSGPVPWESAICYAFLTVIFLLTFVLLGMWPFSKSPGLMKQPLLGIVLLVTCGVLGYVAYIVGVGAMNIEPLNFMTIGISYVFGLLMIMAMFQMWPGRNFKQPAGGFVNILCSVVLGIAGYNLIMAFCNWHFGVEAMVYPDIWFAIAGVMLAIAFPLWIAYQAFFDFWPLPPTPAPPQEKDG